MSHNGTTVNHLAVFKCPYAILQVWPNASQEVLDERLKALRKVYHPDVCPDPDMFVLLEWAYTILSTPALKERYDNYGTTPSNTTMTDSSKKSKSEIKERTPSSVAAEQLKDFLLMSFNSDMFLENNGFINVEGACLDYITDLEVGYQKAMTELERKLVLMQNTVERILPVNPKDDEDADMKVQLARSSALEILDKCKTELADLAFKMLVASNMRDLVKDFNYKYFLV